MGKFVQIIRRVDILGFIDMANARIIPHDLTIGFGQQKVNGHSRLVKAFNQR